MVLKIHSSPKQCFMSYFSPLSPCSHAAHQWKICTCLPCTFIPGCSVSPERDMTAESRLAPVSLVLLHCCTRLLDWTRDLQPQSGYIPEDVYYNHQAIKEYLTDPRKPCRCYTYTPSLLLLTQSSGLNQLTIRHIDYLTKEANKVIYLAQHWNRKKAMRN